MWQDINPTRKNKFHFYTLAADNTEAILELSPVLAW
jgi:5,10-methylenetetrahydrofolate reductase